MEENGVEENGDKERESSPDSPQTDCDEEEDLIMISSKEDTPSSVRVIACLKRREDLKRFEETDECFILDFDPFEESPQQLSKLSLDHRNGEDADVGDDADADADVSLVAEKGPVNIPSISQILLAYSIYLWYYDS
ncbi:hypothetical protein RIF29_11312 [Crotalaria pallida]|uniref:Uncharacterized protein n=1 Tax=Crotalaria pallida TaxID=3830 RepID=A0AAN9IM09_CROPI